VIRVATRRSAQASTQAQIVAEQIQQRTGRDVELVYIDTLGDQRQDVPLHSIGGLGVFVKEVQSAVLDGRADVAVHSAKDLPTAEVDGLTIAAFCPRRDPRDSLVGATLDQLVHGATLATGSVRRRAQIAQLRPDLVFTELRGNIHTRLSKVPAGGAIMVAVAALQILDLTGVIAEVLEVDQCVPSPGQGCVAVECRTVDDDVRAVLAQIDDPSARRNVEVERAFLGSFGTGCSLPIGAHAAGNRLDVFVGGDVVQRATITLRNDHRAAVRQAVELAGQLAQQT